MTTRIGLFLLLVLAAPTMARAQTTAPSTEASELEVEARARFQPIDCDGGTADADASDAGAPTDAAMSEAATSDAASDAGPAVDRVPLPCTLLLARRR